MAKLTPAELQAAKKRKAEEFAAQQKLEAEERAQEEQKKAELNAWLFQARERHEQLASVVGALYDEVDKLARKWPTMKASERTIERTNKAIAAVRELLKDEEDEFMEDITEIVTAGETPEMRDVLMLLREMKAALTRFQSRYMRRWQHATALGKASEDSGDEDDSWPYLEVEDVMDWSGPRLDKRRRSPRSRNG
jgi:hypothetical protein